MAIFKRGNKEQRTGNGERGMKLTIYHEILHSEQFEYANIGTCPLSGHSFRRRTTNASILMIGTIVRIEFKNRLQNYGL